MNCAENYQGQQSSSIYNDLSAFNSKTLFDIATCTFFKEAD